jgi:soluble lytic murein transglycosylase
MPKISLHTLRAVSTRRLLNTVSIFAFAIMVAGTDISLFTSANTNKNSALASLKILSDHDKQLYRSAFHLQQEKDFSAAAALLVQVENPLLKGALLAGPESVTGIKTVNTGQDKSVLHEEGSAHWKAGLDAYRNHDMQTAKIHFQALLDNNHITSDDRAASAFWAYKATLADGNKKAAMDYAVLAAAEVPSFYSMLARHIVGVHTEHVSDMQSLEMVSTLLSNANIRRVIALKEIGQEALAEQELHLISLSSDEAERKRLSILARLIDLPAAQMRMALANTSNNEMSDSLYPVPKWAPTSGYSLEPALIFAIMRQESGFNPNARSTSGALGVMQLMPATAHAMARSLRVPGTSLDPSVNMTLGQSYVEHLMSTPLIGNNLVFLTAAYNAGPGTVMHWQHHLDYNKDPLLFVESIPYSETRDYVLRVIGNYWVYSELLGGHTPSSVTELAEGNWPRYAVSDTQLASMLNHLGNDPIE